MRDFLEATRGAPEHQSLRKALDRYARAPGQALDLGCGAGRDSLALLRAGWKVIALDRDPQALAVLREQALDFEPGMLTTLCRTFEVRAPFPTADLINASFTLPFCRKDSFEDVWSRIINSLRPDGLFAGHFFGPRDDWASKGLRIHDRDQLLQLMRGWTVLELNELEYDGKPAVGNIKHWHLFEVIALNERA